MSNIIVIFILALILGGAISYIVRAKKKGIKCIGCDSSKSCNCTSSKEDESSKD